MREARPQRGFWWLSLMFVASVGVLTGGAIALATHFARRVLTPAAKPESEVRVVELLDGSEDETARVWLEGPDTDLEGSYSFIFDAQDRRTQHLAGHARLGPVAQVRGAGARRQVLREVLSVERGDLRPGTLGRITGWWFTDPEELGYPSRRVSLPLPGGTGWGWLITPEPRSRERWAIHVHGRGSLPEETLRGVSPFARAGYQNLVIAYRNDPGVATGRNGRYGLGLAEAEDIDAVLGWARGQGATHITLVGWSMGGTASLIAAGEGRNSDLVRALVLDSPALDWRATLRHQASLAKLPAIVADLGMLLLRAGFVRGGLEGERGTDFDRMGIRKLAAMIRVPTLIHASPEDTYVPWGGSLAVAKLRPKYVTLHLASGEHVKLWNVNPAAWEEETERFISQT